MRVRHIRKDYALKGGYRHRCQLTRGIRGVLEKQLCNTLEREEFGLHLQALEVRFRQAERFAKQAGEIEPVV